MNKIGVAREAISREFVAQSIISQEKKLTVSKFLSKEHEVIGEGWLPSIPCSRGLAGPSCQYPNCDHLYARESLVYSATVSVIFKHSWLFKDSGYIHDLYQIHLDGRVFCILYRICFMQFLSYILSAINADAQKTAALYIHQRIKRHHIFICPTSVLFCQPPGVSLLFRQSILSQDRFVGSELKFFDKSADKRPTIHICRHEKQIFA